MLRIGIDTGGTFTDLVWMEQGRRETLKVPSTPEDPSRAVLEGIRRVLAGRHAPGAGGPSPGGPRDLPAGTRVVHGSTVATNALLEGKVARVVLLTNAGFEDIAELGRQERPALYDASVAPTPPLVPPSRRFGVSGRMGPAGEEVPLDRDSLRRAVEAGVAAGAERFAVCFLHSYVDDSHERAAAREIERAGGTATLSSRVLPEHREYERTSTTIVSAALSPVMTRYLRRLDEALQPARLTVFRSNGGVLSASAAGEEAVQTLLSGPAAGVIGAWGRAVDAGVERILTFDMGGTSTDVSLCDGGPSLTTETVVGGHPVRLPMIDIHTVGAGGGSLARVDPSGSLLVGPESAGADPGPACYGRGEKATVTDAQLVLGRIPAGRFLDGEMPLDRQRAERAVTAVGRALGLSMAEAALGIVRIASAGMERALRVVSVARGHDPRRFSLFCFGGAGGLHAVDLAQALGLPEIIAPPAAGVFSAAGMLSADVVKDASRSVLQDLSAVDADSRQALFAPLQERLVAELEAEGVARTDIELQRSLDLRYRGQSYELNVPDGSDLENAFHDRHARHYAHARRGVPVQIVSVRVRARGPAGSDAAQPPGVPPSPPVAGAAPSPESVDTLDVRFAAGSRKTPLYMRQDLHPGEALTGPAVIADPGSTLVVPEGWSARVDGLENLRLTREPKG